MAAGLAATAANGAATTEGGDILVLGRGTVLVGMSERTTPQGVERLARRLFDAGSATRIVALAMPQKRAFMHLDTVMTMVDEDTFTKYVGLGLLASRVLQLDDRGGYQLPAVSATAMPAAVACTGAAGSALKLGRGVAGACTVRRLKLALLA